MPAADNAAYLREWARQNPEKMAARRDAARLRKYGLTPERYEALFEAQGYACAACGADEHGGRNWHIDHCHGSDEVRGILCHGCNVALGMLRDDEDRILALGAYIATHAADDPRNSFVYQLEELP